MPTSVERAPAATTRKDGLLVIDQLVAGYGAAVVLDGVSAQVGEGEIAVIVGPNGSGKSTLLKTVSGGLPALGGDVRLAGERVTSLRRDQLVRKGLGYVPQENEVFAPLSVRENLMMGGYLLPKREVADGIERVLATFPILDRLLGAVAGRLSGGERKVVAMGRALMRTPRVVLLDEPTANLSPVAAREVLASHIPALAASGTGILLVEQRATQALEIADWAYVLVGGRVALEEAAATVRRNEQIGELFLGARPASQGGDP